MVEESSPYKTKLPVIFLMGPTASGKTDLAIGLYGRLPVDLISVDSALVYRGMDIGTAKPDRQTLAEYPHALVDICDPTDSFSAARFAADAELLIKESHDRGRIPLLVGGTMLYFKALLDGLAEMPPTDLAYREHLQQRAEAVGWPALHRELRKIDPITADRLHPNHSARIERALQIYKATGVPMSEYHADQGHSDFKQRFDVCQIGIFPRQRKILHDRIEARLALMFEQGFVDEVQRLHERADLNPKLPSIRAVGYRQLWSFFEKEISLDAAKEQILFATRKLAKRQLTWMRSWSDLYCLYTHDVSGVKLSADELICKSLELLGQELNKESHNSN